MLTSMSLKSVETQKKKQENLKKMNPTVEKVVKEEIFVHEYHYNSMLKTDPFIPPKLSSLMAVLERPLESVLQRHKLTDLKVVGIWKLRNGKRKAMISLPSGEGVIVKEGSLIGFRGKVEAIEKEHILVRQFILLSDGSRDHEDFQLWLEGNAPQEEWKVYSRSDRVGMPTDFGYGEKNYTNSPSYFERRKKLLEEESKQKYTPSNSHLHKGYLPEAPAQVTMPR